MALKINGFYKVFIPNFSSISSVSDITSETKKQLARAFKDEACKNKLILAVLDEGKTVPMYLSKTGNIEQPTSSLQFYATFIVENHLVRIGISTYGTIQWSFSKSDLMTTEDPVQAQLYKHVMNVLVGDVVYAKIMQIKNTQSTGLSIDALTSSIICKIDNDYIWTLSFEYFAGGTAMRPKLYKITKADGTVTEETVTLGDDTVTEL